MHRQRGLRAAFENGVARALAKSGRRSYNYGPGHYQQHYPGYQQHHPGYQQYQQAYHQQYQGYQRGQQQQRQQQDSGVQGSWSNPVVVQTTPSKKDTLVDNLSLMILFAVFCSLFGPSLSIVIEERVEPADQKKSQQAEGDAKKSTSSAPPSSSTSPSTESPKDNEPKKSVGSTLFSSLTKSDGDKVEPVDLNSVNHSIKMDDVLGCDEAKAELAEVVEFLKHPDKFTRLGGRLPKGYLLVGPPGTGKTMLAKALAKEAGVPFFYASGAQFEEVFIGVGSRRVRDLFEAARAKKPCLVFIDEIDAIGGKRSGLDASHDRATINQFLSEMDGFHSSESVIVIAATNSPKSLDKALTRPGRFDRMVNVDPPDLRGRTQILEHYLKKVAAGNFSASTIAKGTSGMTGADLKNVVNLATLQAAKDGQDRVTIENLEDAKDRVLMGIAHTSRRVPEHERVNTAYHEAGHALVALMTEKSSPLHKATIIPRGQALGLTVQLPPDDQISMSLAQMKARLRVLMGGRIAEEVTFGPGEVTSGASNDLEQATSLARAMVRNYGLSSSLGLMDYSFADDPNGIFLSNKTRSKIDDEVKSLLDAAHRDALHTITTHHAALRKIAEGLLTNDTLTGDEMREMANLPAADPETQSQ